MFSSRKPAAPAQVPSPDARRLRALWLDPLGRTSIRALQALLIITVASVVVYAMVQLKLVVIPVLISVILAAAFAPVVMWLRRHGWAPIVATWAVLIAGIVIFGGIITAIVFAVRNQWGDLADAAVQGFRDLSDYVQSLDLPIAQVDTDAIVTQVEGFVTSSQFGSGAVAGVSVVAELATSVALIVVLLFFFLKDGDVIWRFFLKPLDARNRARGERIGHVGLRTLGGYVRGTAIIALVDSVFIGVGLFFVGVPLALPLAVIVFFGAFIPIVGATVAGILAALIALVANGPVAALIVIIIVIGVNQIEGNFLQPVVMAQSLKLHPLVVLVALTAGTILGGIIGAIISVPIAAVAWAIIKAWHTPPVEGRLSSPDSPGTPVA